MSWSFEQCHLNLRLVYGTVDLLIFNIASVLAFEYFSASRQIYNFSKNGRLPTHKSIRRTKCVLISFTVFSAVVTIFFYITTLFLSNAKRWDDVYTVSRTLQILMGLSMLTISCTFVTSLCYLHKSLAKSSFEGHLSRKSILLNAVCYLLLTISQSAATTRLLKRRV